MGTKSYQESSSFELVDLSVAVTSLDTPVFPGNPQPIRSVSTTARDRGYLSYAWTLDEHTGTHVDSPSHFDEGALTIEKIPIDRFVGKGIVLDFEEVPPNYTITRADISSRLENGDRKIEPGWILLFYTGYTKKSRTKEWMHFPELSDDACRFILDLEVKAVGFDAPSPDRAPFLAHKILLPKVVSIYENLNNLDRLLKKNFLFVGVPLALTGGSGSPVRAVALIF